MSGTQEVIYGLSERVATITINRPERRNAFTPEVMAGLSRYLDRAGADPQVGAIILTGAGDHFCTGADLGGGFGSEESFLDQHQDRGRYRELLLGMNQCPKPILAAIKGYCLAGGMGLCLSSDVVIAHEAAQFGVPEIKRGLWPYMVTALLVRNVGRKKALELCMTGDRISAAEAERIGLINHAVPAESFADKVAEMAGKLSSFSPAVMGLGKSAFYSIADMSIDQALRFLQSQLTINGQVEDLAEGIAAFMEKRSPVWKGR
jgi:enoyl-CoA hydratase/carnithine racemase